MYMCICIYIYIYMHISLRLHGVRMHITASVCDILSSTSQQLDQKEQISKNHVPIHWFQYRQTQSDPPHKIMIY